MKRISPRQKLRIIKLTQRRFKKWLLRRERRQTPRERRDTKKPTIHLPLPEIFSFRRNYEGTLQFLHRMQETLFESKSPVYVDFRPLRSIGSSAALVLTAELYRWRHIRNSRLWARDVDQWDPKIRQLLFDMGLFDILKVSNASHYKPTGESSSRFVRFRTGNLVLGQKAHELSLAIERICGHVPNGSRLYQGLTEAMTNVSNHAYPNDFIFSYPILKNQWWMSAFFDKETGRLTITVFDQGIGIPQSLPRVHAAEHVRKIASSLGLNMHDEAHLIRAAMEIRRSRTHARHRGKGLPEIRSYTDLVPDGRLRVLSGRGEYQYHPGATEQDEREMMVSHESPLGGTLVHWEATVNPNER